MALVTAVVMELINILLKKVVERRLWWPSAMLLQKAMLKNFGYPDETCTSDMLLDGFTFILCISSHHFLAMMLPVIVWVWESAGPDGELTMMKLSALL